MQNRQIKFRAWDTIAKTWFNNDGGFSIDWDASHITDDNDERMRVSPTIKLMQFTGLQDSKGVDIYEGDLIKRNGHIYKVTFESGGFCITGKDFAPLDAICIMHHDRYLNNFMPNVEVIGHIYDPKFSNLL